MAITFKKPVDDNVPYQQRLVNYSQDTNAGRDEFKRAMSVYRAKSALGDTEGANAAKTWSDQVNTAIGGVGNQANDEVRQALATYKDRISKPATPFTYDINSIKQDPLYTSALASYAADANRGTNQSLVNLGRRGIGNSQSAVQAELSGQKSINDYANTKLAPEIIAQKYQQYRDQQAQDQQQNQGLLQYANALNGIDQQEFDNQYKSNAQAEQQKQSNWNAYLQSVGLTGNLGTGPKADYSLLGGTDGPRSMAGQQVDYQKARDSIADEQYKQKFDEDVRRYGMDYALRQDAQANQFANSAADNARANASLGLQQSNQNTNNLFKIWEATGKAPAGIPGVAEGTPMAGKEQVAKSTDYKTNPNFADDVAYLKSNQAAAAQLDSNPQAFIQEYGYDGYLALRKAAGLE